MLDRRTHAKYAYFVQACLSVHQYGIAILSNSATDAAAAATRFVPIPAATGAAAAAAVPTVAAAAAAAKNQYFSSSFRRCYAWRCGAYP
jgi:hypothetical protein